MSKDSNEWWTVRSAAGRFGLVPVKYMELSKGDRPTPSLGNVSNSIKSKKTKKSESRKASSKSR